MLQPKLINKFMKNIAFLLSRLPSPKGIKTLETLDLMRKDVYGVAEQLISEMKKANIILSTPLMVDLVNAFFNVKPAIPYRYQVQLVSDIALKYPGQVMPFIMFDPRRRSVTELIKTALEEMGFLGVKMYPSLGYHPDPSSILNDAEVNHVLDDIYEYCEERSIPITAHCSRVGAICVDLLCIKELAFNLCQPSAWEGVLKRYPTLNLNFAHFGGDHDFLEQDNNTESWSRDIQRLIKEFENTYTDISFHNVALNKRTSTKYFNILTRLLDDGITKERIIFGTDWPMARYSWREREYVEAFHKLPQDMLNRIAFQNPLNFLFPGKKLPQRIRKFFASNDIPTTALPEWMKNNLEMS
jgi:predicted TIM-barrel fold metal-dependent hydrolase